MKRSLALASLAVSLPIVLLAGCGGSGTPAEKIRPKDPTFAGAMGEKESGPSSSGGGECREVEASGEPLVVDWKPEQRGDLEVLMREGVAVVSYSCKGLELLKDCHVDGKYGFLGMTKKEQVVRLTNADEVKANLPLAGAGIAANIGAEMQRGATLDVALVMVGKVKTTWAKVAQDELRGECNGATHFVKGAIVGAFVMETGTKGEAKTAAQLFSAGASAQSASSKSVRNKDGDINDCAKADPDAKKAPPQCQAMVRLELKAIAPKAAGAKPEPAPETKPEVAATVETSCPKGMVLAAGKCTAETKEAPAFLCSPKDAKQCLEQCEKGHAGSCGLAGIQHSRGVAGAKADDAKAKELLGKGCDGGDSNSCFNLGLMWMNGRGGSKDPAQAAKLWEKGCAEADAASCNLLGNVYETGQGAAKDEAKALALYTKGCEGGSDDACGKAGRMTLDGRGGSKDVAKATDFLKRACDGNVGQACADLGLMQEVGKDAPKNAIGAKLLYQRGCIRGNADACVNQARLELGQGGSADNAKRAFESACNFKRHPTACAAMKVLFGSNAVFIPPAREMNDLQRACNAGSARDCATVGAYNLANGNKAFGGPQVDKACTAGDPFGCALKNKK